MSDPTRYKQVFRGVFNFSLVHSPPSTDLGYWVRTAEDVGKVCGLLGGDQFTVDLMAAVYTELERRLNDDESGKNRFDAGGDLPSGS